MTDEIYRPPISLEQERREVEMMAGTPDNPGDGFASSESNLNASTCKPASQVDTPVT